MLAAISHRTRIFMGGPGLVGGSGHFLPDRRGERRFRIIPSEPDDASGMPLGDPPDIQLRAKRRLSTRRRGLPVGLHARENRAVLVPGFQYRVCCPWAIVHYLVFTSPIHHAWIALESPPNWLDGLAAALFALFWIGEAVADQQMWRFQQQKKARQEQGLPIETSFITTGLFQYCRHPNFFCELGMWWVFYLFAIAATGEIFNWSGLGLIALTDVFFGSSRMTETISASRYPSYSDYQAATPRLISFTRLGCIKSAP